MPHRNGQRTPARPVAILACTFFALGLLDGVGVQAQVSRNLGTVTPLYSSHRTSVVPVLKTASSVSRSTPRVATIDESTRWQFVSREMIEIQTSIIRLGDVIRPLQPDLIAWKRLSGATIGLMPADGGDAKVSRDRLADLISRAKATPQRIKIYGPETILVRRTQRTATSQSDSILNPPTAALSVPLEPAVSSANYLESVAPIDQEQHERLERYVLVTIRNQHREIFESYEVKIKFASDQITALDEIQGIRHIAFLNEVPPWSHTMDEPIVVQARITGRAVGKDQHGIAQMTLRPYPAILAARSSLRRGQRVTLGDFQHLPYSSEQISLPADTVERPEDVVGMEVVGLVREGVPLSFSDFAAPRVIRRGDLIEVRVGGGGIQVTTGAKSLGDGAISDLIEIETLSPKRRLLAKVVHASLVEIVTQATHVHAEPKSNSRPQGQP